MLVEVLEVVVLVEVVDLVGVVVLAGVAGLAGAVPVAAETVSTLNGPSLGLLTAMVSVKIVANAQLNVFNLLFNEIPPLCIFY
jgi:hypothetical protein